MIRIVALNSKSEPFNLDYINVAETVFFHYEPENADTGLSINGTERWEWNFDADVPAGSLSDQVPQSIVNFQRPFPVVFTRPGIRKVSVKVYKKDRDGMEHLHYLDEVSFAVFKFPDTIRGAEYAAYGTQEVFTVDNTLQAESYRWFINGRFVNNPLNQLTVDFGNYSKAKIRCLVTNGDQSVWLEKSCVVTVGDAVSGTKYEHDVTPDLRFFNKEGDMLNFQYMEGEDGVKMWDGDMIFHNNGSDTFKTIGLYVLEKVEPIKFVSQNTTLQKVQLFNEHGMDFHPNRIETIRIEDVQSVNNLPGFYTKWIMAPNIHTKIPLGTEVVISDVHSVEFDGNMNLNNFERISEMQSQTDNGLRTYTVIGNRRDAVMVLTETDNSEYNRRYGYGELRLSNNNIVNVPQGTVTSLNLIKVYDTEKMSTDWNQPDYMQHLYANKKLSVLNTQRNDGLYTVTYADDDISNGVRGKVIKGVCAETDKLLGGAGAFGVEVSFKTSKVLLSSTPLDFLPASNNEVMLNKANLLVWEDVLGSDYTPGLLKVGSEFTFESQTGIEQFNGGFRVSRITSAGDALPCHSDDENGYRVTMRDTTHMAGVTLTLDINGKSTIALTESADWLLGTSLEDAAKNLSAAIRKATKAVSVLTVGRTIHIWEKAGNTVKITSDAPSGALQADKGAIIDINPLYGIYRDEWVDMNNDALKGYVHHKVRQGVLHVLYFNMVDGVSVPVWYAIPYAKKVVVVEPSTTYEFGTTLLSDAYLNTTTTKIEHVIDPASDVNAQVDIYIAKHHRLFREYGLDIYRKGDSLCVERVYPVASLEPADDYIDLSIYSDAGYTTGSKSIYTQGVEMICVKETLKEEHNHVHGTNARPKSQSALWERRIRIDEIDYKVGFNLTVNGIDFPVAYDNVASSGSSGEQSAVDIEESLMDWGNQRFAGERNSIYNQEAGRKYFEVLESMGVLVWLDKSGEAVSGGEARYDTIVLQSRFPNNRVSYRVHNTLDQHAVLHSDVTVNEIVGSLRITVNNTPYTVPFTSGVRETIGAWVYEHAATLWEENIIATCKGNVLSFATLQESDKIKYQVWVGKNATYGKPVYTITHHRKGCEGIILSGNEVLLNGGDFQNLGFSTGMVVSLGGSRFPLNNQEYNLLGIEPSSLSLSYQGAFWGSGDLLDYTLRRSGFDWREYDEFNDPEIAYVSELTLHTREFLRYPREGYDGDAPKRLTFSWQEEGKEMFFYDFTGEQLKRGYRDEGLYQYKGATPLVDEDGNTYLNPNPNRVLGKVNEPKVQQTIFSELYYDLKLVDAPDEISPLPTPIQVFVGYNSPDEGVHTRTMLLHREENVRVELVTKQISGAWENVVVFDEGTQTLTVENGSVNFIERGFKVGQVVKISGYDNLNTERQMVFQNAGFEGEITAVNISRITFKPLFKRIASERSTKTTTGFPQFRTRVSALTVTVEVQPKLIGQIVLRGQTEIEDDRFRTVLDNFGYNVKHRDVYIFRDYDIKEKGIDWTFLNAKRKEMLLVHPEIYNYISAYKSMINTINYFGYNDLELNEYYLNINPDSTDYRKLHKVEIPDIFNNRVEGWNETDYIKQILPSTRYMKTKLFNLSYKVTDFEGNNVLGYSLDEVVVKLLGLKRWMKEEVMMVGTNIKDLTGKGSTVQRNYLTHDVRFNRKVSVREQLTPVDFKVEAYLQPVENNSRTYNVHIEFFAGSQEHMPDYFHLKITTFANRDGKLRSVQIINEYRTDMRSYNFAADQSIDAYIQIEVMCDNGYGANYKLKRTYSLAEKTFIS